MRRASLILATAKAKRARPRTATARRLCQVRRQSRATGAAHARMSNENVNSRIDNPLPTVRRYSSCAFDAYPIRTAALEPRLGLPMDDANENTIQYFSHDIGSGVRS